MQRTMLKSKIHRAVITEANLHYVGSISIDQRLLEAADILAFEQVAVWNVTRGTRLTTYAIAAPPDSGTICLNGAAAHGNVPGDIIIIASFVTVDDAEARSLRPKLVQVDQANRQVGPVLDGNPAAGPPTLY